MGQNARKGVLLHKNVLDMDFNAAVNQFNDDVLWYFLKMVKEFTMSLFLQLIQLMSAETFW